MTAVSLNALNRDMNRSLGYMPRFLIYASVFVCTLVGYGHSFATRRMDALRLGCWPTAAFHGTPSIATADGLTRTGGVAAHANADLCATTRGKPAKLVVCNWKCYPSSDSARGHISRFARMNVPDNVQVVTAPCSTFLGEMVKAYRENDSTCVPCSQDVSAAPASFGPFTGEVTAGLLKDLGVTWTIVGHSERREAGPAGIEEARGLINRKLKAALSQGLTAILCVGETKGGDTNYVIQQLEDLCEGVGNVGDQMVVAYEPSSSVGTDRPVEPEEVNATIASIKQRARCNLQGVRFLYGGSVNNLNATQYTRQPHVDGIMVGRLWQDPAFEAVLSNLTGGST